MLHVAHMRRAAVDTDRRQARAITYSSDSINEVPRFETTPFRLTHHLRAGNRSRPRSTFALDAILEAVARTLESHGKAGLTTQRVADTAGFSIGAVYQYFPNKEGLIEALAQRELARLTRMMAAALEKPAHFGTGINARRMIRVISEFIGERPRSLWRAARRVGDAPPQSELGIGNA